MLAVGGRVIVIGSRGDVEITPRDLMARDASIVGMMLWSLPDRELNEIHRAIHTGLRRGVLKPVINVELPLAEAAEAHRRVMAPGALGKIVLVP
jgi:NADPH:quinone reductase